MFTFTGRGAARVNPLSAYPRLAPQAASVGCDGHDGDPEMPVIPPDEARHSAVLARSRIRPPRCCAVRERPTAARSGLRPSHWTSDLPVPARRDRAHADSRSTPILAG